VIAEGLVIFSCIVNPPVHHGNSEDSSFNSGSACSSTSSLYFSQNPEVKTQIDKSEKIVTDYVGPSIVNTVGPALFVVAGGSGTIKINKYFSLQFTRDSGILSFRIGCP
jgi:hypothetical protein